MTASSTDKHLTPTELSLPRSHSRRRLSWAGGVQHPRSPASPGAPLPMQSQLLQGPSHLTGPLSASVGSTASRHVPALL